VAGALLVNPDRRRGALALVLIGALVLGCAALAPAADDIRTIPTRPGVTEAFILVRPSGAPVASVILFAGGNGLLALGSGKLGLGGNFLVRNRARFASEGLLVAVVDTPSDHPSGLDGFRTSAAHAEDIRALIAALKQEAPVPVWLIGTSMGTVSAANGAARLSADGPDGLVLTSTVTRAGRERPESVGDVRLGDVRVPTLIVHHKNDACRSTPYADTPALLRDFKVSRKELLAFDGGDPPQSGPCDARAAHGYFGIDAQVVTAIVAWIKATPRP
jgi:predicted alpha/beta-hydrolase family hydrolase